jgi:pyruvate, orthophosphate dikinase
VEEKYKPIYFFNDTDEINRKLFGEKGAKLMEMNKQGVTLPPGFIVTSAMCLLFYDNQEKLLQFLMGEIHAAIQKLEKITGKTFGGSENPLFVSVDSSSYIPINSIIDNISNVGMNESTILGLIEKRYNQTEILESYLRFITLFSTAILGINVQVFKELKDDQQKIDHIRLKQNQEQYLSLIKKMKSLIKKHHNINFPDDPYKQLELAISAMYKSWIRNRERKHQSPYDITKDIADGIAIIVCEANFDNIRK